MWDVCVFLNLINCYVCFTCFYPVIFVELLEILAIRAISARIAWKHFSSENKPVTVLIHFRFLHPSFRRSWELSLGSRWLRLRHRAFHFLDQAFCLQEDPILQGSCSLILSPLRFGSPVPLPEESAPVLSVPFFLFIPKALMGVFLWADDKPRLEAPALAHAGLAFPAWGEAAGLWWSCGVPCPLEAPERDRGACVRSCCPVPRPRPIQRLCHAMWAGGVRGRMAGFWHS